MCYFTWATARLQQLLFVALAAGLWCFTTGRHVKSPLFHQPQTEVWSTMGETIRASSFHNPTLSLNKHVVQICRSSLSAAANGLAQGSGERRTSPFNDIERSLSCAVIPKPKSLPVSATTFPTVLSLYIAQGRLRTDIRYPSCSQGRTVAIRKGNKHQLGLFFLLEACQWNAAGWSTAGWPANGKLPLPHRHSSITWPCCSSAKLLVFTCTRALGRLRTRSCVWPTRGRGNYMHDHSRFQRDIDWRHRRLPLSLLLLLLLTKSHSLRTIYQALSRLI